MTATTCKPRRLRRPRSIITVTRCNDWRALHRTRDDADLPIRVRLAAIDRLDILADRNPYMTEADKLQSRTWSEYARCHLRLIAHADRMLAR